jgi:hypothetical protein
MIRGQKIRARQQGFELTLSDKNSIIKAQATISVMAPALLLGLNLLVFGTFAIFSENRGEFLVAYPEALKSYYLPALLVFLGVCLVPSLLGDRISRGFSTILFILATVTYIHGNLLLWNTGVLDGNQLDLSRTWRSLIDALIWVALTWLAFRYRGWLRLHGWKICVTLILFQLIGVYSMLSHSPDQPNPGVVDFSDDLSAFSREANVIHLVLDGFQASIFEQLLSEQPELADEFEGFTFFRDATTSSNVTYLSVPAALSGKAFVNDRIITDYQEQTLRGHNLYSFLAGNGFAVDIAVPLWWNKPSETFTSYFRIPTPYTDRPEALRSSALLLADISLYRQAPHFFKHLIYRSGLWLFSGKLVAKPEQQFEHFSHNAFFANLIGKMNVSESQPRYKFIHLVTPHAPLVSLSDCAFAGTTLDYSKDAFSQQSLCTVRNVVAFLTRLKSLGLYDKSLLVIHGDHGGGVPFEMQGEDGGKTDSKEALNRVWGNPLPLVLIKPMRQSGKLTISDQAVQLLDLPATVSSQLGLDGSFPGQSMFDNHQNGNRERFYYQSQIHRNEAAAKNYFEEFSAYRINGSVYDVRSWHGPEPLGSPMSDDATDYRPGDKITFGREGNSRLFQKEGWGMGRAPKGTWTLAGNASLMVRLLELDSGVTMRMRIKPFLVPGLLDAQRVRVFVADVLVGEWSESGQKFHFYDVTVPGTAINQSGLTKIRFELPDAQSPVALGIGPDKRKLALEFLSIEFLP